MTYYVKNKFVQSSDLATGRVLKFTQVINTCMINMHSGQSTLTTGFYMKKDTKM